MESDKPVQIHFHSSLPSHISTELALLQTFIRRAAAQHRTQLFLQRMEGVLRVGKALLGYVRACAEKKDVEEKMVWKGECLVCKMIQMLYSAQYLTSQIIDLHHFIPLQTAIASIYARLFTATLSLATALDMDTGQLVIRAGQLPKKKAAKVARQVAGNEAQQVNDLDFETGFEMGEKIARSSLPMTKPSSGNGKGNLGSRPPATLAKPLLSTTRSILSPSASKQGSPSPVAGTSSSTPAPENETVGLFSTVPEQSISDPAKKKKLEKRVAEEPDGFLLATEQEEQEIVQKKKKRPVQGEAEERNDKVKVTKKKRKDAMDDIFGF